MENHQAGEWGPEFSCCRGAAAIALLSYVSSIRNLECLQSQAAEGSASCGHMDLSLHSLQDAAGNCQQGHVHGCI